MSPGPHTEESKAKLRAARLALPPEVRSASAKAGSLAALANRQAKMALLPGLNDLALTEELNTANPRGPYYRAVYREAIARGIPAKEPENPGWTQNRKVRGPRQTTATSDTESLTLPQKTAIRTFTGKGSSSWSNLYVLSQDNPSAKNSLAACFGTLGNMGLVRRRARRSGRDITAFQLTNRGKEVLAKLLERDLPSH